MRVPRERTHTNTHTPTKLLRDAYCRPKHTNVDYAIKCLSRSRSFTSVRYLRAYGGSLRFIFIPLQWISVCVCVCVWNRHVCARLGLGLSLFDSLNGIRFCSFFLEVTN